MSTLQIRGVMLDSARLIESRDFYHKVIPLLGSWGYNTLFWHFTDDQGCMMEFSGYPELASRHAYTKEETRELVEWAGQHGLSVVPEVECFGHTGFITRHPRYAHLRDGSGQKAFAAICPFLPESRELLADLLRQTAEVFPSPFIHVGLDEVGFGDHPETRRLLQTSTKWELFAEHVCWLHSVVTGLGRTMLMWGDHLLGITAENQHWAEHLDSAAMSQEMVKRIPKDIVICDWHYSPRPDPETMEFFLREGFLVIAAPSTVCHGTLAHPRQANLENLRYLTGEARRRSARGVLGVMNTVWCPYRYFPGATLHGMAWAAHLQCGRRNRGGKQGFDAAFLEETFGLKATASLRTALEVLYRENPHLDEHWWMTPVGRQSFDGLKPERIGALMAMQGPLKRAHRALLSARPRVGRHHALFDDIVFAAEYLATNCGRPARLLAVAKAVQEGRRLRGAGNHPAAKRRFSRAHTLLQAEGTLASEVRRHGERRWAASRFPRSEGYGYGQLMDWVVGSEAYLKRLARQAAILVEKGQGAFALPLEKFLP